ncbi:integrase core domain-containing protein [Nocardia puris]|uniref:integrase core domain-containing protein n=1 Tax=Nocardia puris TaxID=208602 RepID=UPI003F69A9EA
MEWFSRRRRDECPNINSFWSLAQARVVISDWKEEYNHRRRDSGLGCNAPAGYATTLHPLQLVLTRGGPTTGSRHRSGYSDPVGAELVAGQPKSSPDRCPT